MESWSKPDVEFFGPIERYDVLIDGRRVPFVEAKPMNGGMIHLTVGTAALDCSVAEAESMLPFVADAIAVALGYVSHPLADQDDPVVQPRFVRVHSIFTETPPDEPS